MKMKYKIILWGIGAGFFSLSLTDVHNIFRLSDIVMESAFYGVTFYPQYVVYFINAYMPLLFFQLLMGYYIYQHYCCASFYFFSRLRDRKRWFFKEACHLYGWTILYLLIYLLTRSFVVALIQGEIIIRSEDILLTLIYIVIYSLFLFSVTLLINLLSILTNNGFGFVMVQGLMYLLATIFLLIGRMIQPEEKIVSQYSWLIKYNYLANLFFPFHSCRIKSINELLNAPGVLSIRFGFLFTLIFYMLILVILLVFGCILISKKELILESEE